MAAPRSVSRTAVSRVSIATSGWMSMAQSSRSTSGRPGSGVGAEPWTRS